MRINRNVTHKLFTTVRVNEVIVEPGDTVQDLLNILNELAWEAKVVEVDGNAAGHEYPDAVRFLFEAIA